MAKSAVEKYRGRPRRPSSSTWRAFLTNHMANIVALDFFTVPTVGVKVLFVLIVLAHNRRKVVHFNVTEHPTAQWTCGPQKTSDVAHSSSRILRPDP